eukprot:tig00000190_g13851.t1
MGWRRGGSGASTEGAPSAGAGAKRQRRPSQKRVAGDGEGEEEKRGEAASEGADRRAGPAPGPDISRLKPYSAFLTRRAAGAYRACVRWFDYRVYTPPAGAGATARNWDRVVLACYGPEVPPRPVGPGQARASEAKGPGVLQASQGRLNFPAKNAAQFYRLLFRSPRPPPVGVWAQQPAPGRLITFLTNHGAFEKDTGTRPEEEGGGDSGASSSSEFEPQPPPPRAPPPCELMGRPSARFAVVGWRPPGSSAVCATAVRRNWDRIAIAWYGPEAARGATNFDVAPDGHGAQVGAHETGRDGCRAAGRLSQFLFELGALERDEAPPASQAPRPGPGPPSACDSSSASATSLAPAAGDAGGRCEDP